MFDITSRLEINLDDPRVPIPVVTEYAAKYRASAIVVQDPTLIHPLIQSRLSTNGKYKIILAIDFHSGAEYAMAKFRNFSRDVDITQADGYDIRLTTNKANNTPLNEVEVSNEIRVIRDFLQKIRPTYDVRFTIDMFSRPWAQIEHALKTLAKVPCNMIRLETHLAIPESKANIDLTKKAIETIRRYTPLPIKVSTNVNRAMIDGLKDVAARFDVNMLGMQKIVASLEQIPSASSITKPMSQPVVDLGAEDKAKLEALATAEVGAITEVGETVDLGGRTMVKQKISAKKSEIVRDPNAPHQMRVQKSLEVNSKLFTAAPTKAKRQSGNASVTPPPKNAKKQ